MLKTLTTYLLSVLSIGLISQSTISLESAVLQEMVFSEKHVPLVKGKLIGYTKDSYPDLVIRYTTSTLSFKKQVAKTALINTDGSFDLKLDYGIPYQEIWLSIGDLYFGKLLANEPTVLSFDLEKLSSSPVRHAGEGVSFTGANSKVNSFVNGFEEFKIDRKKELISEKLSILMNSQLAKSEKVEAIKKIYKKLASIENSYAKKNDKSLQWILTNDRLATMYADIISVHWGKKMNDMVKQECLAFKPCLLTNASVQYYDFLNFYLEIPNRLETKLITERTLRDQLAENESSADLDRFLREYDKKRDNLRYDQELFLLGEESYLERYEYELKSARLEMHLKKIRTLEEHKANLVSLLGQPKCIKDREQYIDRLKEDGNLGWALEIMKKDLILDKASISKINKHIASFDIDSANNLGIQGDTDNQFLSDASTIAELLANIKGHFRNEAVIIDLWVPWSDQCARDLGNSNHISKAIDTLPVQMVYLCSSNDVSEKYWQDGVSKILFPGIHIYLNQQLSAEIMEYFQVRTYPTYFFLDREGHFDPDFITSLGDLKTKKLIARLNIETKL